VSETPVSLLNRLRDTPGDNDAWRCFHDIYRPLLTSWLRRHGLQNHDLDDLLQEILAAVVRALPQFQYDPARGRFRAWLRTILVNRLRQFWRERQASGGFQLGVLEQLEDPRADLTHQWDEEHDRHVVGRFLEIVRRDFSATTWQAFERRMAGEKAASIAAALRLTPNAVHLARSSVLHRLREEMNGLVE
jgi:RNA polymerase sigma-70 factor (ECF subfamily)